ncbi:hypothetical protein [Streptomyces laurentii]|uniref:hypothetical protein n=1 Tax=Streptomyces laurentii TaxID=39478 RepID=UPI0036AC1820
MHDQAAMRTEGVAEQLSLHPQVKAEVDEGYRGLANEFPGQVTAPPQKPRADAPDGENRAWCEMRHRQSSRRIAVEHANAEMRQWRPLRRYTGHRETYAETHRCIAGLVSDRAARRPTQPAYSTELVPARQPACSSPTSRTARPAHPNLNRRPSRKAAVRRCRWTRAATDQRTGRTQMLKRIGRAVTVALLAGVAVTGPPA